MQTLRIWYGEVTGTATLSGTVKFMSAQSQYELVLFSDGETLKVEIEGDLGSSGAKQLSEIRTAAEKLGIQVQVQAANSSHN